MKHSDFAAQATGRPTLLLGVAALCALISMDGMSQSWPVRRVTIVSPYSPGGITDTLARIIAEPLGRALGQPVIVENQTGAGGHIAGAAVARAKPDGYTLLMAAGAMIVASPNTQPDIVKYDTRKDLEPIGLVAELPVMLVAHPLVPGSNLKEFIEYAREHSEKINCASTGIGSGGHLACVQLANMIGKDIPHIAYKGAPEANADLLANRVQLYFGVVPTEMTLVRTGKLRAFGVATERRLPSDPNIPTLREQGFPVAIPAWNALFAPAGTPAPILAHLSRELETALRTPEVRARIAETQSVMHEASGPGDLRKLIEQDFAIFSKLAVDAGLRKN